jgi:hypothetical protein
MNFETGRCINRVLPLPLLFSHVSSRKPLALYFKLNLHSAVICSSVESTAGQSLSVGELSALVEGLVRSDRCGEASKVALGMLEKGIYPVPRVLRFLVNRLAIAGDIDTLTAIGNLLTPVSIDKYFIFVEWQIIYVKKAAELKCWNS